MTFHAWDVTNNANLLDNRNQKEYNKMVIFKETGAFSLLERKDYNGGKTDNADRGRS